MQSKFLEYRKNYPTFIYHSFDIVDLGKSIRLSFDYEIPGLTSFRPWIEINKDDRDVDVNDSFFRYLVFHIGLIELVSYFKCTCSPNVIIEAGYLSEEQISWFKKLYYYDLETGMNGIDETIRQDLINQLIDKGFVTKREDGSESWRIPLIAKTRAGEVLVKNIGTSISYKEGQSKYAELTEEQKQELYNNYYELLSEN